MKLNQKARRADLLLVLGLLALGGIIALCLLLTERTGGAVQVRVAGEVVGTYSLRGTQHITIDGVGGTNVLVIEAGTAAITEADCPDALCVNMGRIRRAGQSIVCLPHQMVVEIVSAQSGNETDLVAG